MLLDRDLSGKIPLEYLLKLQAIYPSLKKAEHKAADFILENSGFLADASIAEAARAAGCSEPTFVRIAQKIGFVGFAELKMCLRQNSKTESYAKREYSDLTTQYTMEEITQKVFNSCIDAISDTYKLFSSETYNKTIEMLDKAGKILFVGLGDSSRIADLAKSRFLRIGVQSYSTCDVDEMLMICSKLDAHDVVVLISHSGQTAPIVHVAKAARAAGVPAIAITNFPLSPLGRNSDIQLVTSAFQESANGEVMAKRVAQLAIIESIYVNIVLRNPAREAALRESDRSVSVNKM